MALRPEFISLLRDIRDVKYPDIVIKHDNVVAKEALMNPHYVAIDAVYSNESNINAVANNEVNISLVGENKDNIDTVAENDANVSFVGTSIDDVNSVASSIDNVNTLVSNIESVNTVATNILDVNKVNDNISDVNTVATNIADVNQVVLNIVDIQNAEENAADAKSSAEAAKISEDTAKDYADSTAKDATATAEDRSYVDTEANKIKTLSARALTLSAGESCDVSYDSDDNELVLAIPVGPKGDRGDSFEVNATGTKDDRDDYDDKAQGFSYLTTDEDPVQIYFKATDDSGDWTAGVDFGKGDRGEKGDTGIGIKKIELTDGDGSAGTQDTYTITMTDDSTQDFKVTNGADGDLIADKNLSDLDDVDKAKTNLGLENVDNTSDLSKPIGTQTRAVLDSLRSSIANLATSQAAIASDDDDDSIDIDTTQKLISINTTIASTDTNILDTDDDNDTLTFNINASVNFLTDMVFASNTSDERTISIKVINVDDDSELESFDITLAISEGSTETVSRAFLLTVGKDGTPNAPLTVRFEIVADDTGYTLDSFNTVIATSSSYDVVSTPTIAQILLYT